LGFRDHATGPVHLGAAARVDVLPLTAGGRAKGRAWLAALAARAGLTPPPAATVEEPTGAQLAALARELTLTMDLPSLGATIARRAASLCQADAALLYLQRTPAGAPELVATDGFAPAEGATAGIESAPRWLIHSRHPFVSNDTRRDPRVLYLGQGPRHLSVMYAPLHLGASGGDGALVLCARRANAFTTNHLALLRSLADQSAVAVANTLLLADIERRADRLASISRTGQRIAAEVTIQGVLATAAREMAAIFDVTHASAYAQNDRGRVTTEAHYPTALCEMPSLGWLSGRDRPLWVADLQNTDQLPDLRLRLLERGAHSLLAVPLAHGGERLGALALFATGAQRSFTREDQELAVILGDQTAVALDQARLLRSALDARQRGETILQSSFTAIITVDQRLRVQDVNAAAADLLGLPAEYLHRRPLTEVVGATAWDVLGPLLTDTRRPGPPAAPVECVVTAHAAPHSREVLLGVARLPDGFVVSMTDISRLKAVDRLKSELVANVSHDLKAPLATIRAYTELLLEGLDEDDPALRQTFLQYIDGEVERLNGYITNMLDVARVEAEGFQPRRERLVLAKILEAAVAGARPRAAAKEVGIAVQLPAPGLEILADRHLVHALLANLIDNAVKFSPRGSTVTVSALAGPEGLRLAVADQGPGISPEELPHIFEKFYRATQAVEGSGLGLVIARRAAQAHGGDVTVSSLPGQGSTFTALFPASAVVGAGVRTTPAALL
jgi:signal transduction histidine kinase